MAQTKAKLQKAKANKNDEFYTCLTDIENEIKHYWNQLEGKKIWCNCDDPNWSNFHKFFEAQKDFHNFEVKFTSYQLIPENLKGYTKKQLEKPWTKKNSLGEVETLDYCYVDSEGYCKGDFRAKEQEQLWEWADVIITNPPFSLFREFIDHIMKYEKKFLIIGSKNSITYKETTKLITENKIWCGVNLVNQFVNNKKENSFSPSCWFTNLETPFRKRKMILGASYKRNDYDYQMADNMEILFVKKTKEIPYDYEGAMAVPISFLFKYNPNQFEIQNSSTYYCFGFDKAFDMVVNGKRTFMRLIIKNKEVERDNE